MIACVSSPPDAAPVSNRHIDRSRADARSSRMDSVAAGFHPGRRLKVACMLIFSCQGAVGVLICPFTIYGVSEVIFHPLFGFFSSLNNPAERGCNSICHKRITFFFPLRSREVIISYFSCREGGL